jgi:hypothetical protein
MAIRKIAKLRFEVGVAITPFGLLTSLETASRSHKMSALKEGNSRQPTPVEREGKGKLMVRTAKVFLAKGNFFGDRR